MDLVQFLDHIAERYSEEIIVWRKLLKNYEI